MAADTSSLASLFAGAGDPAAAGAPPADMGTDGETKPIGEQVAEAVAAFDPKDILQYLIDGGFVDKSVAIIDPMAQEDEAGEGMEGPDFSQMEAAPAPIA
jgi:hypothetical protein